MHSPFEYLTDIPLFAALDEPALRSLLSAVSRRTVPRGVAVEIQGQPPGALGVILAGAARAVVYDDAWGEHLIDDIGPGDCVGEAALVDGAPSGVTVVTGTPCELLEVKREATQQIAAQSTDFARRLVEIARRREGRPPAPPPAAPGLEPPGEGWITAPDLVVLAREIGAGRYRDALDVGTGAGHGALAVLHYCDRLVATDLNPRAIEAVRAYLAARGRRGAVIEAQVEDACGLSFADGIFDLVISRIAAHHFPSLEAFACEAFRVLRPGGTLAVVDLLALPDDGADRFINWLERQRDPTHQRTHNEATWRSALERAGFSLLRVLRVLGRLDFDEWSVRLGGSAEEARRFSDEILAWPRETLDRLGLQIHPEEGRVASLSNFKIVLIARRPQGDPWPSSSA